MTALVQISINLPVLNPSQNDSKKLSYLALQSLQHIKCCSFTRTKSEYLCTTRFKKGFSEERLSPLSGSRYKDRILLRDDRCKRTKRGQPIRFKEDFGFDGLGGGGSGGGGGRDNGTNSRVLVNLALAIGLTYLSMTGQLGWVLDTIFSVWLLAVVGLGALIWWAGRDMIQGSCPNCGNDFQVLKSTLNEDLQLCPFCSQPFSVVGNEFVRDPVKFSNQSTTFGEAFSDFSPRQKKGKGSSVGVVDVEAEVKDAE